MWVLRSWSGSFVDDLVFGTSWRGCGRSIFVLSYFLFPVECILGIGVLILGRTVVF